jgi:predicted HTH transcriptional regulator
MDRVPRVVLPPDEIIWLNLDPRAGFVLAQIDGSVTFEDLYAICGLQRLDTARILSQLLEEGVVAVDGQPGSGKRATRRQ